MASALSRAEFSIAAHKPSQWPADSGLEVAFAGRSNVGKSSALNAIAARRALARTSKAPGRTQQIVFYAVDERRYLVDLPGYGYAKVPAPLKRHWEQTIERYLTTRSSLRGLILLMDARRPLTSLDTQMLQWCEHADMPIHILLTKSDKLRRGQASSALQKVRSQLSTRSSASSVQLFSARLNVGIDEARSVVSSWLDMGSRPQKKPRNKGKVSPGL
ncbi:MAG: ribosome biogenesis GTP-binding protein YihA/YsxC [Gammaproteobacteria bacterium]|nr:ribosome biogenesis GTP-binding protein YihA/YsxC [Gammaproteobacteria bacterium]